MIYVCGLIIATVFSLAMLLSVVVEAIHGPVVGTRLDAVQGEIGTIVMALLLVVPSASPWIRWLRYSSDRRRLLPLSFKEAKRPGYLIGMTLTGIGLLCALLLGTLWTLDTLALRKLADEGFALFGGAIFFCTAGVIGVERSVWQWQRVRNAA